MTFPESFLRDEGGMESVEYAIIVGLVVAGTITVLAAIGAWVKSSYDGFKTAVGA